MLEKMYEKIYKKMAGSTFVHHPKCYSGAVIPGKNIRQSLGLMSMASKGIHGNIIEEFEMLLNKFVLQVEQAGGSAIIHFRFETGSYSHVSGWDVSYLIMYGEGVSTD